MCGRDGGEQDSSISLHQNTARLQTPHVDFPCFFFFNGHYRFHFVEGKA